MRPLTIWVIGLLLAGCAPPTHELDARHGQAMRDSVAIMLTAYRTHFAARAWDSLAVLYLGAPGFRWVEDGVVRYRSVAEIRQAWDRLPQGATLETSYRDTEILPIAPGVAEVLTGFDTRFTDSTGADYGWSGIVTMTVVHRQEGWRILGGHTSTERTRPS